MGGGGGLLADTLDGGTGADTMFGGVGNDVYFVDNAGDKVIEQPNEGIDTVRTTVSYTLGVGVQIEVLAANSDAGLALTGNNSNNTLVGSAGNDTLNGGVGVDTLTGNGGVDRFVAAPAGGDQINDFEGAGLATGDVIDLSAVAFFSNIFDLAQAQSHMTDFAGGTTLFLDTGYVTILNVSKAQFVAADFIFS
jgi:Ca2+-binding RTX toxin-like protein